MVLTARSLFWVMQDFGHQPYHSSGFPIMIAPCFSGKLTPLVKACQNQELKGMELPSATVPVTACFQYYAYIYIYMYIHIYIYILYI